MVTRIKICGITRKEDVSKAVMLGVDALGFILAESPRRISLEKTAELVRLIPPFVSTVAVVANPEITELEKIRRSGIFSYVQFHGGKDPDSLSVRPLKTIRAFSIGEERDLESIPYTSTDDFILFDTKSGEKRGGTGETFDWSLLKTVKMAKPFILAGGLGPENIIEAIERCRPAAVDLNSCIEKEPGIKDHEKMELTVKRIREDHTYITRRNKK